MTIAQKVVNFSAILFPKNKMSIKSKKIFKHLILITLFLIIGLTGLIIFVFNLSSEPDNIASKKSPTTFSPFLRTGTNSIVNRKKYEMEKALKIAKTKVDELPVVRTSNDFNKDIPYTIDSKAGIVYKKQYDGRRINICITGVDSRLGSRFKHADANHVLSILIDKGEIEITSIPRDTYADAGMPDTSNQNIIAVLRPAYGRKAYLKRIAQIAELDTIQYYMEFGFSQAIGIIEWLGYDNSKQTLQVLRSRKVLGGGDWQRTYNQGKFIKQAILKTFNNYNGFLGDLVLMGGLSFVETNLTAGTLSAIVKKLKENNFGQSDDVTLRVRPEFHYEFKNFDFDDKEVVAQLQSKVSHYSNSIAENTNPNNSSDSLVIRELSSAIKRATKSDALKQANTTISNLRTYFDQKAWLQISDKKTRHIYRELIKQLLVSAYLQKKDTNESNKIKLLVEQESNLFLESLNKNGNSEINQDM